MSLEKVVVVGIIIIMIVYPFCSTNQKNCACFSSGIIIQQKKGKLIQIIFHCCHLFFYSIFVCSTQLLWGYRCWCLQEHERYSIILTIPVFMVIFFKFSFMFVLITFSVNDILNSPILQSFTFSFIFTEFYIKSYTASDFF